MGNDTQNKWLDGELSVGPVTIKKTKAGYAVLAVVALLVLIVVL